MPGPLEGIRVADPTSMVSGPLATAERLEHGVEVLRELGLSAAGIDDLRAKQIAG